MKKLMKRIGAVLMAVAMMAALGVTGAFAVDTTITATNVTAGDSVEYIRLLEPDTTSTEGWKLTTAGTATGLTVAALKDGITEAEAITIATALKTSAKTGDMTVTGTTASATVDPGLYYLRATSIDGKTVYNPAFVSADYLDGGNNTVSFSGNYGTDTALKKTQPDVPKSASATPDVDEDGNTIQTASVGDDVTYTITPTFPSYPENATNKTLYMGDTMDAGLDFNFDSLTVGSYTKDPAEVTDTTETINFKNGDTVVATAIKQDNGFILNFDYEAIEAAGAPTVTYTATINENAVIGREGNNNTVTLYYTNNPIDGNTFTPTKDNPQPDEAEWLQEISKDAVVYTYGIVFKKIDENGNPLKGAEFKLMDSEGTLIEEGLVSDDSGFVRSTKQLEKGTYKVQETKAPEGYTLNNEVYEIEATWTSVTKTATTTTSSVKYTTDIDKAGEDKTQKGWIKDGEFLPMNTYEDAAAAEADGARAAYITEGSEAEATVSTTTTEVNDDEPGAGYVQLSDVPNTKTTELPSTGGIGTYVFTVAGVAIMAVAAGLLIVRHKKKAE